jgi:germination protein M
MRRLIRAMLLTVLALVVLTGAAGCGKREEPLAEGETAYQIYYLNPSMTKLTPLEYRTETVDPGTLIQELIGQFMQIPVDVDCQLALSEKVDYQGYRQEDKVLYLYFDTNYTSMKPEREILCRAALARTMTQIPGIDYINIYSGNQPLTDNKGKPVGLISGNDFIDSISDVNAYEEIELTLYFTDASGEQLIPEKREVVHSTSASVEQVVLEELISGPESEGLAPTLDSSTKLLNVSVNENVCYLNFSSEFLSNPLEVKDYIPIYSIVNSLSELSTVNRVQITVNGSSGMSFRDTISLNQLFERDLDYVRQ